jgi:hypothetical protein
LKDGPGVVRTAVVDDDDLMGDMMEMKIEKQVMDG